MTQPQKSQNLTPSSSKRPQRRIQNPFKKPQRLHLSQPKKPIRLILRGPKKINSQEEMSDETHLHHNAQYNPDIAIPSVECGPEHLAEMEDLAEQRNTHHIPDYDERPTNPKRVPTLCPQRHDPSSRRVSPLRPVRTRRSGNDSEILNQRKRRSRAMENEGKDTMEKVPAVLVNFREVKW